MNNFTLSQKQDLFNREATGTLVYTVAYDPTIVVGSPEATAVGMGYTLYYQETTANLIEAIYIK